MTFPAFQGNWQFITMFTRACHWSISYSTLLLFVLCQDWKIVICLFFGRYQWLITVLKADIWHHNKQKIVSVSYTGTKGKDIFLNRQKMLQTVDLLDMLQGKY